MLTTVHAVLFTLLGAQEVVISTHTVGNRGDVAFNTSPELVERRPMIEEVVTALSKAQGAFTTVPKTKMNPHFQSAYASLDDIIEMARPHLAANGLAISHSSEHADDGWELVSRLYHTSGQYLEARLPLGGFGNPQQLGSSLTYMEI